MNALNPNDPPRVLVSVGLPLRDRLAFLQELPGTYRFVTDLSSVDLSEWDAMITDSWLVRQVRRFDGGYEWERDVPSRLCIFFIVSNTLNATVDVVYTNDAVSGGDRTDLVAASEIAGSSVYPGSEFDSEQMKLLIKQDLMRVVQERERQFGILEFSQYGNPTSGVIEPFLRGPNGLSLGGRYRHSESGSIWFVPEDVSELKSWWLLALRHWNSDIDAQAFPGVPDWLEDDEWLTPVERAIRQEIDDETTGFSALKEAHEARLAALRTRLQAAKESADLNERVLLSGQDDALQTSVLKALRALGFDVRDMDEEWPERERREDYRISDPDQPEWLAISDATGTTKGAKGAKLTSLSGFATKFALDERPSTQPFLWLVVNRKLLQDPNTRGELLRGDEVQSFASMQGLVLDTVALFILVNAVNDGAVEATAVRAWLRDRTGAVLQADARNWIADNSKADSGELAGRTE